MCHASHNRLRSRLENERRLIREAQERLAARTALNNERQLMAELDAILEEANKVTEKEAVAV